jgi:two-component system, cell cycle response regulator DivK
MTHVLLIEDNEQNRYLTTFLLEAKGYEVTCAVDGPEGVALAERLLPELILLDIQLPSMDGYAVARALRDNPALRGTPIVAVTSYAMQGDRERTIAAAATATSRNRSTRRRSSPTSSDSWTTRVRRTDEDRAGAGRR